jgi:hypothetical protein
MLYSDLPSTYYGVCTYVGFATHRRATVKIRLYIKGLMFMNRLKKIKKIKNGSSQQMVSEQFALGLLGKAED